MDVDALIARLYGHTSLLRPGVIHIAAVAQSELGPCMIEIGPHAPKSRHDFFTLNLARARADVIITTGKILRDEPALRYDLEGEAGPALYDWRQRVAGKRDRPKVVVLTSCRAIDFDHPTFHSWAEPWVFTDPAGAYGLSPPPHVHLYIDPMPNLQRVIAWAQRDGAQTISIEAGATTARSAYSPLVVDEVLRSVFTGPTNASWLGEPFLDTPWLETLATRVSATQLEEHSGVWRFERWFTRHELPPKRF